jgi:DNA recombination protein RmuC
MEKKRLEKETQQFKIRVAYLEGENRLLESEKKNFELEATDIFRKKSEEEMLKVLDPVKQTLMKLDDNMRAIERERRGEKELLKGIREETANLAKALRKPDIRGMWGELQLKRAVELAGLVNQCDYFEQAVSHDERIVRPDLIIKLPGDKQVIVDSKVPFEAFLEASGTEDPVIKDQKLKDHARHIKQHIQQLSRKAYWQQFQQTPEFVILFLPTEVFLSAALECDPTLIEFAATQNIIIVTPATLIGLLKSIAYGWKQDTFSKHAKEISELGHELYKRLSDMSKHWNQVGRALAASVESYNKAMGSFEKRVLVSARKLKEWGAASNEITLEDVEFVEKIPKEIIDNSLEVS